MASPPLLHFLDSKTLKIAADTPMLTQRFTDGERHHRVVSRTAPRAK
jgi:hypothetical protein